MGILDSSGLYKLIITELQNLPHENNDATPRVCQSSSRTASVGSFLKSELFRGSSESELSICSPQLIKIRGLKDTFNPLDIELFPAFKLADLSPGQHASSKPHRRQSIGKKLMSKAFDGLGNARSKSMHFLRSKSSKDSLLRQVSLRNLDSSRLMSSEGSSRNSSRFSFEQESVLIPESRTNSTIFADAPPTFLNPSFILYPDISVIPEVNSVDVRDGASIWVAVVITGVLRKTTDCDRIPDTLLTAETSDMIQDGMKSGKRGES